MINAEQVKTPCEAAGVGMTAKEYLEQIRQIRQEISFINQHIESIRTECEYHPIQLDSTGGSHLNYRTDKLSEKMAEVVDLTRELEEKRAEWILKESEIRKTVDKLSNPSEREVLVLRYMAIHPRKPYAPLGWKTIGFRMGYTAEGARKIHDKALKNFDKIINCTES